MLVRKRPKVRRLCNSFISFKNKFLTCCFSKYSFISLFRWGTARIAADIVLGDDGAVLAVRLLQVAVQAVRVPAPEDAHRGLRADPPWFQSEFEEEAVTQPINQAVHYRNPPKSPPRGLWL